MRKQAAQYILNAIGLKTATFTAATTDIVTANAHGLVDGNKVVLTTTGTLPAGLATSTVYYVVKINANTFYLNSRNTTAASDRVDITGTGTGTHTWTMHDISSAVNTESYKHCVLAFATDGGGDAAMTVKVQGSVSETCPDFSAAQSATNHWDYVQVVDLEDGATIDGDTGWSVASADDYRLFEVNINHLRWVSCIITAHTEGEVTVLAKLTDNS